MSPCPACACALATWRVRVGTWLRTATAVTTVVTVSCLPGPAHVPPPRCISSFQVCDRQYIVEINIICPAGYPVTPSVRPLSPHDDIDEYFAEPPGHVSGAAEPPPVAPPVEVLSRSLLSGPPVVESTPLGARISRPPDRLTLSGPRPRHLRKSKRGRIGGRRPGVGRGDDGGGAAGGHDGGGAAGGVPGGQ